MQPSGSTSREPNLIRHNTSMHVCSAGLCNVLQARAYNFTDASRAANNAASKANLAVDPTIQNRTSAGRAIPNQQQVRMCLVCKQLCHVSCVVHCLGKTCSLVNLSSIQSLHPPLPGLTGHHDRHRVVVLSVCCQSSGLQSCMDPKLMDLHMPTSIRKLVLDAV